MGAGYAVETALRHPERGRSLTLASPVISGAKTPRVASPTLIIVGALDQPHILRPGEEPSKRVPAARRILYAGHMLNMETPHQFKRDLEAFLSQPGR